MKKALIWSAVLLGALSSGCGGSAMQSTAPPPKERNVALQCNVPNGDLPPLDKNAQIVVFYPTGCDALYSITFDQLTPPATLPPGFTLIGSTHGSILYYYDYTKPIDPAGYHFKFADSLKGNNGSGVIK